MVKLFDFTHRMDHDLHVYTSRAADDELTGWRWQGFPPPYDTTDRHANPWFRYGINNNDGEDVAVWRALAWALSSGNSCYAIPVYYRDDVAHWMEMPRESVTLVRWQYEMDCGESDERRADHGFVPARSCVRTAPPPEPWEVEHRGETGIFPLTTFDDLTSVELGICRDATSEVGICAVSAGPDRFNDLVGILQSDERPDLSKMIREGELWIDLSIVRDRFLGLSSYFLIKSHDDISGRLHELVVHFEAALDSYIEHLPQIDSFDSWCAAVDKVLSGPFVA